MITTIKQFIKKHLWALLYGAALIAFTTYITLDTFVISHVYSVIPEPEAASEYEATHAETDEATESESVHVDEETETEADEPQDEAFTAPQSEETPPQSNEEVNQSDESSYQPASPSSQSQEASTQNKPQVTSTDNSYKDENISITITEHRANDTTIYVADITLSSPDYLKTALAKSSYGKNVTEKTSEIASDANAILAINGDYYGARESGYVIRNGILYRSKAASNQEDLVIYSDGSFEIISEDNITAEELLNAGAVQVFSFGPALITNGVISVSEDDEVGKAKASNPRTAIGIIDNLHYVFVVSDGRTSESAGLSLSELAEFMSTLNVKTAYNLDGGGSSTMYFNGSVVNNPTTNGKSIKERSVSDIVFIGY